MKEKKKEKKGKQNKKKEKEKESKRKRKDKKPNSLPSLCERSETPGVLDRHYRLPAFSL